MGVRQVDVARNDATRVERNAHAVELSRRELEVRREALTEQTISEAELDLGAAYPAYLEERAAEGFVAIEREPAQREVDELKDLIRKLGNVNLDAIDELSQLEVRNEELVKQLADIDNARTSLEALVKELDDASRTRFQETFERVRETFAGQTGMFRRLFGGGSADIGDDGCAPPLPSFTMSKSSGTRCSRTQHRSAVASVCSCSDHTYVLSVITPEEKRNRSVASVTGPR